MAESPEPPRIAYWHVWTDQDGVSRQTRCWLEEFDLKSIGGGASAQWLGSKQDGETTTMVTVLPVGWVGAWHENPKPQWIIPLRGRWSVKTMDGQTTEMGPGDISFGEDQGTRERDGRKGHYSTTVGHEPAVLFLVQSKTPPTLNRPCRLR